MKNRWLVRILNLIFSLVLVFSVAGIIDICDIKADDGASPPNPYIVDTVVDKDGREIDIVICPLPPPDIMVKAAMVPEPDVFAGTNSLGNVPAFDWCYGCSATSAAMMAGYYDNNGYSNMYAGPSNGGVCPLNNETAWTSGECPLSATQQGYDELGVRGHVDDYWFSDDSSIDPYYGSWTEHTYADCTGDFMGTNQYHNWHNIDGGTTFFFSEDNSPVYDYNDCETETPPRRDGCHGLRLFMESRGYTVSSNYNQYIYGYNSIPDGFTFNDYKAQIDAGRVVLIQVRGHTMLGIGYNDPDTIYLHDTWDHDTHPMQWGGIYLYDGKPLQHYGVTVIELQPIAVPSPPTLQTIRSKDITDSSATLVGRLTDLGSASQVTLSFVWGTTEACVDGETSAVEKSAPAYFGRGLSGLSPGTLYYYKAKAVGSGTSYGEVKSFSTTGGAT